MVHSSKLEKPSRFDSHVIFFLFCCAVLTAFVLYLHFYSRGSYQMQKVKHQADRIAADVDFKTASDAEVSRVIRAYEETIEQQPLSNTAADLYFQLAYIYTLRDDYEKAILELKKIVQNFSNKSQTAGEARFIIGKIYEKLDRWEEALTAYQETIAENPLSQKGLIAPLYIAEYYKVNEQEDAARESYEEAVTHYRRKLEELGDIQHAAILYNFLALTYTSQGRWEDAVVEWEALVEKFPRSRLVPTTLMALGEVYAFRLRERTRAAKYYQQILRDFVDTNYAVEAKIRLIQLYFATSGFRTARFWAKELLEESSVDPAVKAEALLIVARTYQKEGNWKEAEGVYESVITDYAGTQAALRVPLIKAKYYESADSLEEANRLYEEALLQYQKLAVNGADPRLRVTAQDLISMTHFGRKDWASLLDHLDSLIAAADGEKRKAQLHLLKANVVNKQMRNPEDAKMLYEQFLDSYSSDMLADIAEQELYLIEEEVERKARAEAGPQRGSQELRAYSGGQNVFHRAMRDVVRTKIPNL